MEELTVRQYADSLEDLGYMSFGEPFVYYKIEKGKEKIQFYLDFDKHRTQVLFSGGHLAVDPSRMRDSIFNLNKLEARYSLSAFVKEYDSKIIVAPQLDDLKRYGRLLGNSTNTKYLTYFLARKILQQDMIKEGEKNKRQYVNEVILPELLQTFEAIGKPEHLAYVARLDYFSSAEKDEFVSFPLSYLARSFEPPNVYEYITLPRSVVGALVRDSSAPYSRQLVSVRSQ